VIALTRQDILAHQKNVPWVELAQVEQDLLLSLAMVALFNDSFLSKHIAMRGGTVLHKVHLAPPSRYSEDIDLVVITDRDENHVRAAIKRVLRPVLGSHKAFGWHAIKLALRNASQPSRILRVEYEVPSVAEPGRILKIKIEANVTERIPYLSPVTLSFSCPFQGEARSTKLVSYDINEMLGTKLRALFQRIQGRDLFDLYLALNTPKSGADPIIVAEAFGHYMAEEGKVISRAEFVEALEERLRHAGFRSDMKQLIRAGVRYDIDKAGDLVRQQILGLLPG